MSRITLIFSTLLIIGALVPQVSYSFTLDTPTKRSLLKGDWESISKSLSHRKTNIQDPVARFLLGHAYLATNLNDESMLLFVSTNNSDFSAWSEWSSSLMSSYPDNPIVQYLVADANARIGQFDQAIEGFTRAITMSENNFPLARNARGVAYAANNNWDTAQVDFYLTTKNAPNFADGFANLGSINVFREVSIQQGNGDAVNPEPLKPFKKALDINKNFSLVYNGRGCLLFGIGRFDQAMDDFQKARDVNPLLGLAELNQGYTTAYGSHALMLANVSSNPKMSIESSIEIREISAKNTQRKILQGAPDQKFDKLIYAIPHLSVDEQQAVIDQYGWKKVKSAINANIEMGQAQAMSIGQEVQFLHGNQKSLHKLRIAQLAFKGALLAFDSGSSLTKVNNARKLSTVKQGSPIRQDIAYEGFDADQKIWNSTQKKIEKRIISSGSSSETMKTIVNAIDTNPYKSTVKSFDKIGDALYDNKIGATSAKMAMGNMQVAVIARQTRGYSNFLKNRSSLDGVKKSSITISSTKPVSSPTEQKIAYTGLVNAHNIDSIKSPTRTPSFSTKKIPTPSQIWAKDFSQHGSITGAIPRYTQSYKVTSPVRGVSTKEIGRSFVDKGNWPVMTTFGLLYEPRPEIAKTK